MVGFASLGSFSARFRELVGSSPTAYRDAAVAEGGRPPVPGCYLMMWTRPHDDAPSSAISEKPADGDRG